MVHQWTLAPVSAYRLRKLPLDSISREIGPSASSSPGNSIMSEFDKSHTVSQLVSHLSSGPSGDRAESRSGSGNRRTPRNTRATCFRLAVAVDIGSGTHDTILLR